MVYNGLDFATIDNKKVLSKDNEKLAWLSILKKLQMNMEGFPTSIEEDKKLLAEAEKLTFNQQNMVKFRLILK